MFVAQGVHLDPITCIIHKLDMKSELKVLKGFYSIHLSELLPGTCDSLLSLQVDLQPLVGVALGR